VEQDVEMAFHAADKLVQADVEHRSNVSVFFNKLEQPIVYPDEWLKLIAKCSLADKKFVRPVSSPMLLHDGMNLAILRPLAIHQIHQRNIGKIRKAQTKLSSIRMNVVLTEDPVHHRTISATYHNLEFNFCP